MILTFHTILQSHPLAPTFKEYRDLIHSHISPTLFACFLNDLSQQIKATNLGMRLKSGDEVDDNNDLLTISNLLYADDIVLLS